MVIGQLHLIQPRPYPADFLEWWAEYPRRQSKPDAFKAWRQTRLVRPPQTALLRITRVHAKVWAAQHKDQDKMPLPATWLRGERWEDEFELPGMERFSPQYIIEEETDADSI